MTTIKQIAHTLAAADLAVRHQWPSPHDEAMHYRSEFGRAKGMLAAILNTLDDAELPESVRAKVLAFQKARVAKALQEWGEGVTL